MDYIYFKWIRSCAEMIFLASILFYNLSCTSFSDELILSKVDKDRIHKNENTSIAPIHTNLTKQ